MRDRLACRPGLITAAIAILTVASTTMSAGCATTAETAATPAGAGPRVGGRLPAFALKDFEGHAVDLGALEGKVVLLDIWASWCAPCKEELPMLDAMASRLGRKGVVVVAVSIDESKEDAVAFLATHAKKWSLTLAHDPKAQLAEKLQPPKMPTSYLVDRGGIIRQINAGFQHADADTIEARLTDLAAKNP